MESGKCIIFYGIRGLTLCILTPFMFNILFKVYRVVELFSLLIVKNNKNTKYKYIYDILVDGNI